MSATGHQQTLFVDISELAQRDSKTGIQRVVRSIVRVLIQQGAIGYRVEFIHAHKSEPYRHAREFVNELCGMQRSKAVEPIAEPRAGDIFLGLDFQNFVVPLQAPFFQRIQAIGVKVYFVVYDLLPIHFERYFAPNSALIHSLWLNTVAQSDGAVCISRAVATELEEWLQANQPIRRQPFEIGWFHLGADIEASQPSAGLPDGAADTLRAIEMRPTFLLVGTIEPRKGQQQALTAFKELWQSGLDINLVLAGKQGWMVESLIADLKASPELGKRLFWLDGISDEFLAKIYAASTCLIAASEGEGFGLPLIESAQYGLPIIARDIPVFREVAGSHAHYFTGLAASTLAEAIVAWLALNKAGQTRRSGDIPFLTWSQSTAQLLDVVCNNKWHSRWVSDGFFRCNGSDPRLKTQVGRKRGLSLETTGTAGMLLYGPYTSLPADEYRLRIYGRIEIMGRQPLQVELKAQFGKHCLHAYPLDDSRHTGTIVEFAFIVPAAVTEFEICLAVSAETEMSINKLEVSLGSRPGADLGDNCAVASKGQPVKEKLFSTHHLNVQEVLLEDGESFIEAAYIALLKRRPDAVGARGYLRALRNGTSKLQILDELSASDECQRVSGSIPGLAEACARERLAEPKYELPPSPPAEVSQISRAEQLFLLKDIGELITIAYWVLLKRAPDPEGLANYIDKLKAGTSKTQFLHELYTSAERRERGVELPGLKEAFAREGLEAVDDRVPALSAEPLATAASVDELLSLQGADFVNGAYLALLKRPADAQELQDRLTQLLAGAAKIEILSEMAASKEKHKEGDDLGVTLQGLAPMLTWYRWSRLPVLGKFVRIFASVEGNSPADRRGRAAEQRLLTLEAEFADRFAQLEHGIGKIAAIETRALADREDVDAQIESLENSVVALRVLMERYAERGGHSVSAEALAASTVAKSSGRLAFDLRADEILRDLRRVK